LPFCDQKNEPEARQNFTLATSANMMTVPADGAERLAELFREIFALSETNPPDHSKSAAVDDSIKLFDTHGASGTSETCAPKEKQPTDERSETEDQEPRR
jgi:hypothetical protein